MDSSAHLDVDALAELKDIMEDEFGSLIETYLADAVVKIQGIEASISANDASELREAAHSFKGASCNIGASQLADLCEQAEHHAREGRVEEAAVSLPAIIAEFEQVRTLLQAEIS